MKGLKILFAITLIMLVNSVSKELVKFTVSSYILPNKDLEMQLDVVTPRSPGSYPVILYLTGLSGIAPEVFQ